MLYSPTLKVRQRVPPKHPYPPTRLYGSECRRPQCDRMKVNLKGGSQYKRYDAMNSNKDNLRDTLWIEIAQSDILHYPQSHYYLN
jgi:hypothetical protein